MQLCVKAAGEECADRVGNSDLSAPIIMLVKISSPCHKGMRQWIVTDVLYLKQQNPLALQSISGVRHTVYLCHYVSVDRSVCNRDHVIFKGGKWRQDKDACDRDNVMMEGGECRQVAGLSCPLM